MRPSHMTLTVRQFMLGVLAMATFLVLPDWLATTGGQVLWIENGGIPFGVPDPLPPRTYYHRTILSPWVIPALTLAIIWPHRARWSRLVGIIAIGLVLGSWLMLRRAWILVPGGIRAWPDDCLWYLKGRLTSSRFQGRLTWAFFWPTTGRQVADLSTLVAFLAVMMVSLVRPVRRRIVAIIAGAANLYAFGAWSVLMWSDRYWGAGEPPLWPGHLGSTMPRASGLEIVQGAALFGLICYLLSIIIPFRLCRAPMSGTAQGQGRPSTIPADIPE